MVEQVTTEGCKWSQFGRAGHHRESLCKLVSLAKRVTIAKKTKTKKRRKGLFHHPSPSSYDSKATVLFSISLPGVLAAHFKYCEDIKPTSVTELYILSSSATDTLTLILVLK